MNKVLETDEKKAMDAAITDAAKEWVAGCLLHHDS